MTPALALALCLTGASPERALFLFELRGVPAGTVELRWRAEAGSFTYRSTHLFTRGADRTRLSRVEELRVDGEGRAASGQRPSALWLWRRPKPGCVAGREELSGRVGPLCAEAPEPSGAVRGTMFGEPFRATYAGEALETLALRDARFTAIPRGTSAAWPPDLFGRGVPVEGGAGLLALEPPLPEPAASLRPGWDEREARALARQVHASIADKRPSAADLAGDVDGESGSCLAHARRFVALARARGKDAAVVHGLLAAPGEPRAYPHVWIRVLREAGQALELDPTSLDAVTPGTHRALAVEGSGEPPGRLWLRLFSGEVRVLRR